MSYNMAFFPWSDKKRSELSGVESALKECAEIRGVKRVLQRKELLRRVKQHDRTLSTVLQTFQVSSRVYLWLLCFNSSLCRRRLRWMAALRKSSRSAGFVPSRPACHVVFNAMPHSTEYAGPCWFIGDYRLQVGASCSCSSDCILMRLRPIAPPSAPQTFYGRDAELTRIIDMILDIKSQPARIAILGPAGYGKTTLARAVLNNVRIRERYCDARYFVPCDSTSSVGALLIELGKVLGMSGSTPDILRFMIDATLSAKDSILCFDNFESAWDQPEDTKHSVEQLLSTITEFCCVTVLITM